MGKFDSQLNCVTGKLEVRSLGQWFSNFLRCDAFKKLAKLCDAPVSIQKLSLPYCEINVTHDLHK